MATGVAAIRRRNLQRVIVVDVALGARCSDVRTGQRETGHAVVETGHVGPGDRVVALGTVRGAKSGPRRRVHRVIGLLPGA